jgi:hypothetical protein
MLQSSTPSNGAATTPTDGTSNQSTSPATDGAASNDSASTNPSTAATPGDESATPTGQGATTFNIGVQGGADWLMLTAGRVPRELSMFQRDAAKGQLASDLRRVTYFLLPEGGLARHETTRVTASDLPASPDAIPDPFSCVIASEVTSVAFEYFDGSGWVSSWNGADPGEDGQTPIGPPAAIAVTLTIMRGQPNADGQFQTVTYRHVVAIPAANSLIPPAEMP